MKSMDPVRKKIVSNGHPLPIVSLGTTDLKLLRYMKNNKNSRFNIKAYSRLSDIRRSTIYGKLAKLEKIGLVIKPYLANYVITRKGIDYIDSISGVQTHRVECRKEELSEHFIKYKLPISDKIDFNEKRLIELNPIRTHKITWNNDFIHYAYFEDCTLVINPKVIFIKIHDITGKSTENISFEALTKALDYMTKLTKIGLKTASIELEKPHYARVKSYLADFLKKNVDDRYYLELENGTRFWIDCSPLNELEDETDSETARKRIDKFMKRIMNEDINFDDLKEIKEIAGMLVTVEAMKMRESLKLKEKIELEKPDYFG